MKDCGGNILARALASRRIKPSQTPKPPRHEHRLVGSRGRLCSGPGANATGGCLTLTSGNVTSSAFWELVGYVMIESFRSLFPRVPFYPLAFLSTWGVGPGPI